MREVRCAVTESHLKTFLSAKDSALEGMDKVLGSNCAMLLLRSVRSQYDLVQYSSHL